MSADYSSHVNYGIEDRPPIGRALLLATQHLLTMFGSTVAVPLLLGPAMGMDRIQIGVLISSVMLCSGVATFLQATWGTRLPIIQGVSFSFLAAFTTIIAKVQAPAAEGGLALPGPDAMRYIAGAVIAGALFEIVIGFSGLMGLIRRVLSPVVVGPVIMLIGLALYNVGAPVAATHWPTSILTIVLIILFSFVLSRHYRACKLFPLLFAIAISWMTCIVLSSAHVYRGEHLDSDGNQVAAHPAYVNFQPVDESPWLRTSNIIFPWGLPVFSAAFIVATLAGYLASMIESFGDYHACAHLAGAADPTPAQISRGIGFEGIGCALTGFLGGFSSTSYSENIGLVGLTRVGSRYVVQIAAVILIFLGVVGKFGAVAATIPKPIVGGLYCALFGLISAVGVRQLAKADLNVDRNLFVAGFSLFMGLSVPAYFQSPDGTAAVEAMNRLLSGLGDIVAAVGHTGMAVAAILGLILDNIVPGTPQARGLATE